MDGYDFMKFVAIEDQFVRVIKLCFSFYNT